MRLSRNKPRNENRMARIFEIRLIGGVIMAVAAFGGTDPGYFLVVEIVLLVLGGLLMLKSISRTAEYSVFPAMIPLLLVAIIVLQIVHLPVFANSMHGRVSAAPFETLSHLTALATYFSAFFMTITICRRPNGSKILISALLGLGAMEACFGLVQFLTGYPQIFGYTKTINLEMATGTFINYDHFAGLMEMILPFALAGAFYQLSIIKGQDRQKLDQQGTFLSREELAKLAMWIFLSTLLLVALVFSESRMGLVAAILSALSMITLMLTSGAKRASAFLLPLAFLAPALSMIFWIGPEPVIARFEKLVKQSASVPDSRMAIWRDTLNLIGMHPWAGTGLGTFAVVYPSVQSAFPGQFVDHAHNDYLEFASECGIPATVILFAAIFYIVAQSVRSICRTAGHSQRAIALGCFGSMVAILLHSLTDFNLQIPANTLLFAVVLGISYANSSACTRNPRIAMRLVVYP
jgi:O-antigen ligase